jgi:hypothetical protein
MDDCGDAAASTFVDLDLISTLRFCEEVKFRRENRVYYGVVVARI